MSMTRFSHYSLFLAFTLFGTGVLGDIVSTVSKDGKIKIYMYDKTRFSSNPVWKEAQLKELTSDGAEWLTGKNAAEIPLQEGSENFAKRVLIEDGKVRSRGYAIVDKYGRATSMTLDCQRVLIAGQDDIQKYVLFPKADADPRVLVYRRVSDLTPAPRAGAPAPLSQMEIQRRLRAIGLANAASAPSKLADAILIARMKKADIEQLTKVGKIEKTDYEQEAPDHLTGIPDAAIPLFYAQESGKITTLSGGLVGKISNDGTVYIEEGFEPLENALKLAADALEQISVINTTGFKKNDVAMTDF